MHFTGLLYRAHNPVWSREPLSGEGAARFGGRFNRIGRIALYTSLAPETALREAYAAETGTLYGAWPDGTPFEGNRYVDRYVVKHGLITQMDVWNDSAEWLMVRAGLATL